MNYRVQFRRCKRLFEHSTGGRSTPVDRLSSFLLTLAITQPQYLSLLYNEVPARLGSFEPCTSFSTHLSICLTCKSRHHHVFPVSHPSLVLSNFLALILILEAPLRKRRIEIYREFFTHYFPLLGKYSNHLAIKLPISIFISNLSGHPYAHPTPPPSTFNLPVVSQPLPLVTRGRNVHPHDTIRTTHIQLDFTFYRDGVQHSPSKA